jgi:hypothetical protein
LRRSGFIALDLDAAYQGESADESRGLEDLFQQAEDVRSAVTYVSTQGFGSGALVLCEFVHLVDMSLLLRRLMCASKLLNTVSAV